MSNFVTHRVDFPCMAWFFDVPRQGRCRLLCGEDVEVTGDGFFEGCYAGDWSAFNYDEQENVFGSGMRIRGGVQWFVSPSHTLEPLYIHRHAGGYAVSNSLEVLVGIGDIALPFATHYGGRFASAVHGIDHYESLVARWPGGEILRVFFDNFRIDEGGGVVKVRKPDIMTFYDYATYRQGLHDVLAAAFANAGAPTRRKTYLPLSTCSSGYDSATCAALAAGLGCSELITLREARSGVEDSGRTVGEAMGLHVIEVERQSRADDVADLLPFLATGMGAEDYCFRGFSPSLPGRVLLTGFHGDKVWDVATPPNATLHRGDMSGSSLQGFRQKVGFCHIPVPMIGARKHAIIHRISMSEEMLPYRIGGAYDRPIPRRIVEEKRVPRQAFGQIKKAASLLLLWDSSLIAPSIKTEMTRTLRRRCPNLSARAVYTASVVVWEMRQIAYRVLRKLPGGRRLASWFVDDWHQFSSDPPRSSLAFLMAMDAARSCYEKVRQVKKPISAAGLES